MRPPSRAAWWTKVAVLWFVASVALLVWPLYPWLGNHIHPRVLGLPWSLVYVLGVIGINAVVLNLLYWRRIVDDREAEEQAPPERDPEAPR